MLKEHFYGWSELFLISTYNTAIYHRIHVNIWSKDSAKQESTDILRKSIFRQDVQKSKLPFSWHFGLFIRHFFLLVNIVFTLTTFNT